MRQRQTVTHSLTGILIFYRPLDELSQHVALARKPPFPVDAGSAGKEPARMRPAHNAGDALEIDAAYCAGEPAMGSCHE